MKNIREILSLATLFRLLAEDERPCRRKKSGRVSAIVRLRFEQYESRNLLAASSVVVASVPDMSYSMPAHAMAPQDTLNTHGDVSLRNDDVTDEDPTITLTETDGATDGSTDGTATFTASGGGTGVYATVNYSVSGPGDSDSGSVSLTGGGSSSLTFSYNPTYGGTSQAYTVSSDVGTVTVTVYPAIPTITLTETDGATDGSTDGTATFTASGGGTGVYATVNYSVSGPGDSDSGSVSLTGGGSSSLTFSYNPTYGGTSQAYTVSSDVGTVTVTVYPALPTITLTETDGATDGSTDGTATFTASGGGTGVYATVNYSVSGPGDSDSGSVSLTGGGSSSLTFSYNPTYGGTSQAYTVSSDVGTVTVTVYPAIPTITLTETDGATDGSTDGTATFTASGGGTGVYATVNYSVSGPGDSDSGSVSLTGGGSSSLTFSYNPTYGGTSQAYTVSSDVGTVTVTVYPALPTITLTETDGATDGSTDGTATFTASGGGTGVYATVNYSVSGPGDSDSGSVSLTGGGSSSLTFSYNPTYGGTSQAYTVSSDVGTVTVTVYPASPRSR